METGIINMKTGGLRAKGINKYSQDKMPLITIITVVRNGEKTLEQTIESVINQTYQNIEYIIIDGASTDRTLEIIQKYEGRIDYWISEPDDGIYDGMNKGIALGKGELIGLLNSDDWYESDACALMAVNYLELKPDVLFGDMLMLYPAGLTNLVTVSMPVKKETFAVSYVHPAVFVTVEAYQKYGLFNLQYKISADYDLLLRFFEMGARFSKINGIITNFRTGGLSTTGATREELLKIAVEHKFSQPAIIQRWLLCIYVKVSAPVKKLFPFLVFFMRKIVNKQIH
jgi:glycosyltransferase involved in cell wall biosynthesis